MEELNEKELEMIGNVLRYRRNELIRMSNQSSGVYEHLIEFLILEKVICKKLNIDNNVE